MSNNDKPFSNIEKLRSAIKHMLYLAITLESTDKLVKTRNSDKQEISNYIINQLEEN